MKFIGKVAVLGIALCLAGFTGCVSTSSSGSGARSATKVDASKFPKPAEIQGKIFEGESNGKAIKYVFSKDGTFEKYVDGEKYDGKWSFDEAHYPSMAYVLDWQEGDAKKGYLVTIMKNADGTLTLGGYWYLTDAYIVMNETVAEVGFVEDSVIEDETVEETAAEASDAE